MTNAETLVAELKKRRLTCATAESCTGGGVGALITGASGASEVFLGGVVSYTNNIKRDILGVPESILNPPGSGAVSEECAAAMAQGARRLTGADIAVSVTGLAGPGGDGVHPQGYVCFGVATASKSATCSRIFAGDRAAVRKAAADFACSLIVEEARRIS